jgi:hypothetical protein
MERRTLRRESRGGPDAAYRPSPHSPSIQLARCAGPPNASGLAAGGEDTVHPAVARTSKVAWRRPRRLPRPAADAVVAGERGRFVPSTGPGAAAHGSATRTDGSRGRSRSGSRAHVRVALQSRRGPAEGCRGVELWRWQLLELSRQHAVQQGFHGLCRKRWLLHWECWHRLPSVPVHVCSYVYQRERDVYGVGIDFLSRITQ